MEQVEVEDHLELCYYCEEIPIVEPWHGGSPTKHMASCVNDYCDISPSVIGNTKAEAIERWNHRPLEIIAEAKGYQIALEIVRLEVLKLIGKWKPQAPQAQIESFMMCQRMATAAIDKLIKEKE